MQCGDVFPCGFSRAICSAAFGNFSYCDLLYRFRQLFLCGLLCRFRQLFLCGLRRLHQQKIPRKANEKAYDPISYAFSDFIVTPSPADFSRFGFFLFFFCSLYAQSFAGAVQWWFAREMQPAARELIDWYLSLFLPGCR